MLNENIVNLRKKKGLSQEELANRLHVVRQTVSKWEKGLSVPDAQMLVRLAEELDTQVSTLLGETQPPAEAAETLQSVTEKLEKLNEQFARQNERRRKISRFCLITVCALCCWVLVLYVLSFAQTQQWMTRIEAASVAIIGGADGPTAIFLSGDAPWLLMMVLVGLIAGCAVGIWKLRRK